MVSRQVLGSAGSRTRFVRRVAVKMEEVLKGEPQVESGSIEVSARIASTAAAVVIGLDEEARRELSGRQEELIGRLRGLFESFGHDAHRAKIELDPPQKVESGKGAGLGQVLDENEGRKALDAYAVGKRLEDWAGPVAGATELNRDYGIPRSSLNRWQHAGDVIGLLKGTQKHVYPIDQFIDGRPAKGIAEINAVVPSPRVAWLWLSRGNAALGGQRPIDLLKRDRIGDVVEAARNYFQQP